MGAGCRYPDERRIGQFNWLKIAPFTVIPEDLMVTRRYSGKWCCLVDAALPPQLKNGAPEIISGGAVARFCAGSSSYCRSGQ
jgi:hypothetical protein